MTAQQIHQLCRELEGVRADVRQWQSIIGLIPEAVCIVDVKGDIVCANQSMTKILQDLAPQTAGLVMPPTPESPQLAGGPGFCRTESSSTRESCELARGYRRLVQTRHPLHDERGNAMGAALIWLEAAPQPEQHAGNLEAILEATTEGVLSINLQGRITFANAAAGRMLGRPCSDLLGQPLHLLVHDHRDEPVHRPDEECPILAAVRRGASQRVEHDVFWTSGGERLTVEYLCSPLRTGGQLSGAVISFRDIREQRQLQEQLSRAQKMESVGRLASSIMHDFNNLLTAILGYSELALDSLSEQDPLRRLIEEIRGSGERAALLTRQLLAFSRMPLLAPSVLSLNAMLARMESVLRRVIGENISLNITGDPDLGRVLVDEGQMEQVIMNLVFNARDAMPRGGTLTITTSNASIGENHLSAHPQARPGDHVVLTVSDTGCGMDAATLVRVFEPFFTTKGPEKGTGLGLSLVRRVVEQAGGHIDVASAANLGTTFRIYLPRTQERPASPLPTQAAVRPRGTETLLLVEDDEQVRTLMQVILQNHGYSVLEAQGGDEAIFIFEQSLAQVDLLVTDVVMPNLCGPQLAERLRAVRPSLKVLYLSGSGQDVLTEHGLVEEHTSYLRKPFTAESLAMKVREVLDQ